MTLEEQGALEQRVEVLEARVRNESVILWLLTVTTAVVVAHNAWVMFAPC